MAPKWTKIKNICSGSNFEKLRTFEAHPIFTGSYKKKECTTLASDQESSLIFSVNSKLIINKVRVTTAFLFLKSEKEDMRDLI